MMYERIKLLQGTSWWKTTPASWHMCVCKYANLSQVGTHYSLKSLALAGAAATHKFDCSKLRQFLGWWLYLVAAIIPLKAVLLHNNQGQQTEAADTQTVPAPPPALALPIASESKEEGSSTGKDGEQSSMVLRALRGSDVALGAVGLVSGFASGLLGIGRSSLLLSLSLNDIAQCGVYLVIGSEAGMRL